MKLVTLAILSFCFAFGVFAQQPQVESIEITSSWGGLGTAEKSQISIVRKGDKFVAGGKTVDPTKIAALLKAVDEPDVPKPTLVNLGITPSWLSETAERCVVDCINGYIYRSNSSQKSLFISKFSDPTFVQNQIEGIFGGGWWTDDYPRFEAQIRLNGSTIKISSDSQKMFMIPWVVSDGNRTRNTFNVHISSALTSILSPKFANYDRLQGKGLAETLASSTLRSTEEEWNRLDVMYRVKDAIDVFEKDFEFVSAEINSNHDSDFGVAWDGKEPTEENLHIVLTRKNYPKGFALKLILPVQEGKVQNIEIFKQNIDSYLSLIDSVPWLKNFIDTGGKSVWLRFVKDRSFSRKGMRSFSADMKTLGKSDLAAEVEKIQDKVVVLSVGGGLEYYQSFWLILPDGRSVVWRHYYVSPLPGVTFAGKECGENRSNSKPCVGALISRDGKVLDN